MQANSDLPTENSNLPRESKEHGQKELVEKLRCQWRLLWSERYSDKIRAEDISNKEYESLDVQRGTVIHATRDYKTLNFKEILQQHLIENPDRYIQPEAHIGGWSKFAKATIITSKPQKRAQAYVPPKREMQQPKKGGRGWLHITKTTVKPTDYFSNIPPIHLY